MVTLTDIANTTSNTAAMVAQAVTSWNTNTQNLFLYASTTATGGPYSNGSVYLLNGVGGQVLVLSPAAISALATSAISNTSTQAASSIAATQIFANAAISNTATAANTAILAAQTLANSAIANVQAASTASISNTSTQAASAISAAQIFANVSISAAQVYANNAIAAVQLASTNAIANATLVLNSIVTTATFTYSNLAGKPSSYVSDIANVTGLYSTFLTQGNAAAIYLTISNAALLINTTTGHMLAGAQGVGSVVNATAISQTVFVGGADPLGSSGNLWSIDSAQGSGGFNLTFGAIHNRFVNSSAAAGYYYGGARGTSQLGLTDEGITLNCGTNQLGSIAQGQAVTFVNTMTITNTNVTVNIPAVFSSSATFSSRPTFNGQTPYDTGNFNPASYLPLTGGTMTGPTLYTSTSYEVGTGVTNGIYFDFASIAIRTVGTANSVYFQDSGGSRTLATMSWSAGLNMDGPPISISSNNLNLSPSYSITAGPALLGSPSLGGNTWLVRSNSGSSSALALQTNAATTVGYCYGDTSGNIGFLSAAAGWQFETSASGALINGSVVLAANNVGSYALPIGGGTLTGNLAFSSSLPSITSGGSYITIPNGVYFSSTSIPTYIQGTCNIRGTLNNDTGTLTIGTATSMSSTLSVALNVRALATNGTGQFTAATSSTMAAFYNDASNFYILKDASSSTTFDSSRPLYINLSTSAVTIDGTGAGVSIGGNVTMPSFSITSDRRLKTNIVPLTGSAEIIDKTNVYEFDKVVGLANPIPGGGMTMPDQLNTIHQAGVIAQEVREIAPSLVTEYANGMLGVDYTGYVPHLIAVAKADRARIADLEARLAILEAA